MPEKVRGLLESGNVGDLTDRPRVKNKDGSVSTIRSMSFNDGKQEVLIPTANDGVVQSDDDAINRYEATGEHLGKFSTPDAATAYAEKLHLAQEAQTRDGAQVRKEQPRSAPRNAAVDSVPRAERLERPEDREVRYLDKARKAGYVRNDTSVDFEAGDGEELVDQRQLPKLAMPERELPPIVEKMKGYIEARVPQQSLEQKTANETAMLNARERVDKYAVPAAVAATQASPTMRALATLLSKSTRDRNPKERDISSVQREFSNEKEKGAYIERIRQAQKNAAKK